MPSDSLRNGKHKQSWLRVDAGDGWQIVIPDPDIMPHTSDPDWKGKPAVELAGLECPCRPKVDVPNKVITHNSFYDIERVDKAMEVFEFIYGGKRLPN